jgi:hypothetical protein
MERTFISGFVSAPRTSDMRTLRSRGLRVSMEFQRLVDESYLSRGCVRTEKAAAVLLTAAFPLVNLGAVRPCGPITKVLQDVDQIDSIFNAE